MSNAWLEEDEKQLRNLVALRLSASQIAARMPFHCSRNAVIGKCKRLGLPLGNGRGPRRRVQAQQMPRAPRMPAISKPAAAPKSAPPARGKPAPAARAKPSPHEVPPHVPYVPREPAPIVPSTSFEDRKPGQCAWPVSTDKPYRYCGSERQPGKRRNGKPREYCEVHERLRVTSGVML